MNLTDVRAVVTGGARGMGHHFAQELARSGARVVSCDIEPEGVDLIADVSDEASVEQLFEAATERLGGVPNVLINNAGIIRDALLLKLEKPAWDAVLAVNLTGPYLCARAFAKRVVDAEVKPAVIVNLSSISRAGNMGQSNYSAAKAGLVADTAVWARELARYGVRVGAVAPGFIRTPMVESMRPDVLEKVIKPVPLRRLGEPGEIWQAIRFIVECEYFTGRVVEVDGGLVL